MEQVCTQNKRTGGVMIFLKEHLKYRIKNILYFENYIWLLSLEININKNKYLFSVIYHPPGKEDVKFLKDLEEYLDEINEFTGNIIIMGDINYDYNLSTFYIQKYKDLIYKNGLRQIVDQPTRVTDHSATIIDHVITNVNKNNINLKVLPTPRISDHYILYISIDDFHTEKKLSHNENNFNKIIKCRNYKKYDKNLFQERLFEIPWCPGVSDVDFLADALVDSMMDSLNEICPMEVFKIPMRYINNK